MYTYFLKEKQLTHNEYIVRIFRNINFKNRIVLLSCFNFNGRLNILSFWRKCNTNLWEKCNEI